LNLLISPESIVQHFVENLSVVDGGIPLCENCAYLIAIKPDEKGIPLAFFLAKPKI
jgi:hypothetical protein